MNCRDLHSLLSPSSIAGELRRAISPAMPAFRNAKSKQDVAIPVPVESENPKSELEVTEQHIAHVCKAFLAGELDAQELEFVASAIELCEELYPASSAVAAAVFQLATPEINAPITRASVTLVLATLESSNA